MNKKTKYLNPEIAAGLGNLNLVARAIVEGFLVGLHKSPYHGYSVEFSEYRHYNRGDDIRKIDWKVWGKTERFFIRRYEEETNLNCQILLDCSASMAFSSHTVTKLDYAKYLVSALTYLLLKQRDNFSLMVYSDHVLEQTSFRHSMSHFNYLLSLLEKVNPVGKTELNGAVQRTTSVLKKRGMVIVLSDFLNENEEKIFNYLSDLKLRNNDVLIWHILDPAEISFSYNGEMTFIDKETGRKISTNSTQVGEAIRREIDTYIKKFKNFCYRKGIEYHLTSTQQPFSKALLAFLIQRQKYF